MAKKDDTPTSKEIVPISANRGESAVATAILEFVSRIPESDVTTVKGDPAEECRRIASAAAQKAALTAGSLALPPGPLGWFTILPELVAIWRIQGQLVSDIASAYGKTAKLGREQMLWCLFRHTAAQAFRDVAIRVGDRLVFRTAASSVLQRLAGRIGVSVSKRAVGKGISRWLPIVGALGVGAYAYYDTGQVAKTAIDLFSGDIHIDTDPDGTEPAEKRKKASTRVSTTAEPGSVRTVDTRADAPRSARTAARRSARVATPRPVVADAVGEKTSSKKPARKGTPAATRKRATTKKTVARKSAATKTVKATKTASAPKAPAKKPAGKTAARRAPAKKPATRKTKAAT